MKFAATLSRTSATFRYNEASADLNYSRNVGEIADSVSVPVGCGP